MAVEAQNRELLRLAAKYVWWTPPETVVSQGLPRLVTSVMEMGAWEDAVDLSRILGRDAFVSILDAPPPGAISDRSLAFWHYRLGLEGPPPKSRARFE
jgi:hypothetical protein